MKAFIATFYSPEIQAELLNEILEYYGAQSTVQRATDLKSGGKKNPPNLTKQRSTWPNKAKSVLHKEYFY